MKTIKYGNITWNILSNQKDKLFLITKDIIFTQNFDIPQNEFDITSNDFKNSSIIKYLNEQFLHYLVKRGADITRIIPTTIDLTSMNGIKTYGKCTSKIFLLTHHLYCKYQKKISPVDRPYYLATPWTIHSNDYYNAVTIICPEDEAPVLSYCSSGAPQGIRPCIYLQK